MTGQRLAIQNTLSKKKQTELCDFLGQLVGGKTRVVLGSRSGEEWLKDQTFKTNIYQLQGLDPQSRSLLAEKILERHVVAHRISKIREDAEFARLMKLLAGYPLAMEVVLANLRQQSPKEILEKLQAADVNLDNKRESGDKTESILKCVEYSHSNLSPEAQKLLLCLVPFSGFMFRGSMPHYIKELQKLDPFKDYRFDNFDVAIQEAINWGLLSPDSKLPSLLTIQPVFPYFLKTKLGTLDKATSEALQDGFKNYYQFLAGYYEQLIGSKNVQEQQLGLFLCQKEYDNFYRALQICLDKQKSIDIFFCLSKYLDLIKDIQSNLKLSEIVTQSLEKYPPVFLESELGYQVSMAVDRLAKCYLQTKQYQQARLLYQQKLEMYPALKHIESTTKQLAIAGTYHNLGYVAQELREFAEARRNYQQALEIYIESSDRYSQADTYHNLGNVAYLLEEFSEAKRNYQQALEIYIESSDRYEQASTYHQLGMVAQQLQEFAEARQNYQQALEIYIEFSDRYNQARTYHHLGIDAQELRDYQQARAYYQQALDIYIEFGDRYSQARTYGALGLLAEAQEDYLEARCNWQKALEIWIEYKDEYWCAIAREALERLPDSPENQD